MSEEEETVTSPQLPVDDGIVRTQKQFADTLTQDHTDSEIQQAFQIMLPIKKKWEEKFRREVGLMSGVDDAMKLVDEFEEELKYELATKLDLYVTVDVTPLLEGKPMIVDFQGHLESHDMAKYGLDHEKKTYEVRKATAQGEDYLGQKGVSKAKYRAANQKRKDQAKKKT